MKLSPQQINIQQNCKKDGLMDLSDIHLLTITNPILAQDTNEESH